MKLRVACVMVGFLSLVLSLTPLTVAQTTTQTASALPRLVRFGGTPRWWRRSKSRESTSTEKPLGIGRLFFQRILS
jgi:hypothetical protein